MSSRVFTSLTAAEAAAMIRHGQTTYGIREGEARHAGAYLACVDAAQDGLYRSGIAKDRVDRGENQCRWEAQDRGHSQGRGYCQDDVKAK